MLYAIDSRTDEPRSAHEKLWGVKILARIIDMGPYLFFDCSLDRVFFEAVNVSRSEFLEVLRQACTSQVSYNAVALADLREALACEPEISDETFMAHAEASDADNAAMRWLLHQKRTPATVIAAINAAVDRLPHRSFRWS
jgi:hypothetical protein